MTETQAIDLDPFLLDLSTIDYDTDDTSIISYNPSEFRLDYGDSMVEDEFADEDEEETNSETTEVQGYDGFDFLERVFTGGGDNTCTLLNLNPTEETKEV